MHRGLSYFVVAIAHFMQLNKSDLGQQEDPSRERRLKITEIFHSIQGESTLAGERFSFVRLTGCPLRCTYCDTTYSYSGGHWMNIEDIVGAVLKHQTKWVCITGGEPLAQKRCLLLVQELQKAGLQITIETDGEEDVSPYVGLARLIVDIKTPSSGEVATKYIQNLTKLTSKDEIKFVISNRADYDWSKGILKEFQLEGRHTILFSPVYGQLNLRDIAQWILEDRLNVRLQTQLHKHIWGAETKGV